MGKKAKFGFNKSLWYIEIKGTEKVYRGSPACDHCDGEGKVVNPTVIPTEGHTIMCPFCGEIMTIAVWEVPKESLRVYSLEHVEYRNGLEQVYYNLLGKADGTIRVREDSVFSNISDAEEICKLRNDMSAKNKRRFIAWDDEVMRCD